jgi:CspA family cold shock protein
MSTGTVKVFYADKGYGFIASEDGQDVFVHHDAIVMNGYHALEEGQRVEFEVRQGAQGIEADNVRVA